MTTYYHGRWKERSWSYNDALAYKAASQKIESKNTKKLDSKIENIKKLDKNETVGESANHGVARDNNTNVEQFASKCKKSSNDSKDAISRPKSSKKHPGNLRYLHRALAIFKLSEKVNAEENNNKERDFNSDFQSGNRKGGITFRTVKTKNDVLYAVKADV